MNAALCPYLIPLLMALAFVLAPAWPFSLVFIAFGGVVLADTLKLPVRTATPSRGRVARLALCLWLPVQAGLLVRGLHAVTAAPLALPQFLKISASVGLMAGMLAAPIAHELMHRPGRLERALAEALLALMCYSHFRVEHLRGHHVRVATPDDAATARLGESVYAFYPRAVFGGIVHAWKLEAQRRRGLQRPVAGIGNAVLRGGLISAVLAGAIGWRFGVPGLVFFAAQSVIGWLVLETVNYVQHYGLSRRRVAEERYEGVTAMHAWNALQPVGNAFLFNLGRHSDHHCHALRGFAELGRCEAAPQLPTGLLGMCMLALLPALWFRVMDPLVRATRG